VLNLTREPCQIFNVFQTKDLRFSNASPLNLRLKNIQPIEKERGKLCPI
jgi:hypothetical protein